MNRVSGRSDRELDRELRAHLELEAAEQRQDGVSDEEARHAAQRALGNTALIKEDTRLIWGLGPIEAFAQDVRYGVRLLRRSPAFTLFTVGSLALGIGAASAVFSLFNVIVLRELPVKEPDRLVLASFSGAGGRRNHLLPYPQFERMSRANTTLDGLFAINPPGHVSIS
jgi:hypothetical protein